MVVTSKKIIELSNLAMAAAMDPALWEAFLAAMSGALRTRVCTQLIGYDQMTNAAPLACSSGYDPSILTLYEEHFADKNPYAANFRKCGIGEAITSHELCAPEQLKQTQFYADILHPLEDLCAGGGSMLAYDTSRMFLIGGNMRAKDKEGHEDDWLDLCVALAPAIRQSLEINRMINGLKFEKWASERHLLGAGTALLVVDADWVLHYACPEAQRLLASGSLVRSDMFRRLNFSSRDVHERLKNATGKQTAGNPQRFANIALSDLAGREWICRTIGMRLGDLDQSPFGAFLNGGMAATLLALKPAGCQLSVVEALRKSLSLSHAEAQSVVMLPEGFTPAEVAEQRQVSIHTVRNQIKSALSKSGCRRQSELVQKVEQLRHLGDF
ncbi:helix-turn-helix transcriptional regulator [Roseibium sp.]|uniref:helix-turn-helix transcriptional regulator n=1 Tax=Roseibium sp. TaxID=1936156 RepID=UPI003BAA0209